MRWLHRAGFHALTQEQLFAALERHLGHPVQWFWVTTHPGRLQSARRPFELRRYEVLDTTGVSGLRALLAGAG